MGMAMSLCVRFCRPAVLWRRQPDGDVWLEWWRAAVDCRCSLQKGAGFQVSHVAKMLAALWLSGKV